MRHRRLRCSGASSDRSLVKGRQSRQNQTSNGKLNILRATNEEGEDTNNNIYGVDVEDLVVKYASASDDNSAAALRGITLKIPRGALFMNLGPNGSGKSTLANVLSGKSGYEISGELNFKGENLKKIPVEERAQKGIFLAFQYPVSYTHLTLKTKAYV